MNNNFDVYIYLDEMLIKSITSVLLNGYIDIRKTSVIKDRTFTGQLHLNNRNTNKDDYKYSKLENDGYKSKNSDEQEHCENSKENNTSLEDKSYDRCAEEITKINTTFIFHNEMIDELKKAQGLKEISDCNLIDNIDSGDIIELEGEMCNLSMISYLDTLIDIFSWYGVDTLNNLLEDSNSKLLNYSVIFNMLKSLKEKLIIKGTQDIIFKLEDKSINLIVNSDYFLCNKGYMYDFVHCKCKIIGKVISINDENNELCLTRKSCEEEFYEKVFKIIQPYIDILISNGIPIPEICCTKIKGKCINILPISICI